MNSKIILKPSAKVTAGDSVIVGTPPLSSPSKKDSLPSSLAILFEDPSCFVICKPAGMIVHPGAGVKNDAVTVLSEARKLFAAREIPYHAHAVLVHRLDKDTTGCLLLAKTPADHLLFQKQFADRKIQKTYLAIVHGVPKLAHARIDAPIGRSPSDRRAMSVFSGSKSREAFTTYHVLGVSKNSDSSLLSVDLHTGRTHQIRVHLESIGHPVLGDSMYGKLANNESLPSICLHAWKLAFTLPNGKQQQVIAPPSTSFLSALKERGIPPPKDGK